MTIAMVFQPTFSPLFCLCLLSGCPQAANQEFLEVSELVVISGQ
jgi:hypothetical protein